MNNLNKEFGQLLKKPHDQVYIIQQLDELIKQYGVGKIDSWRNMSKPTRNCLLHEFVLKQYYDVIRHMLSNYHFKSSIKRESDNLTPFELAFNNGDWNMCDLLMELCDDKLYSDSYEQFVWKIHRNKSMNLVWLDLEMTSLINPKILECAVIITDKDLNELGRREWVIHFEQEILDSLEEWHQNAFKSSNEGGNGLFSDVINSTLTREQVENELLDLLKRFCPEKACSLAGNSVHVDREVLRIEMPKVYEYLHYRIVDVTSFNEMIKRWAPITASKFKREMISNNGKEMVVHRAMDDIQRSIESMKMFRPLLAARLPQKPDVPQTTSKEKSIVLSNIDESKLSSDEQTLLRRIELEQNIDSAYLKLNHENQRIYDQNPHLREIFLTEQKLITFDGKFESQNRFLDLSHQEQGNQSLGKDKHLQTTEQWQHRQLLLSEIEFLTEYSNESNCLVVYAGAAPGIHLNYLSDLFPQVEFVLIDSNPILTTQNDRITIIDKKFNEKLAKKYANEQRRVLFICNKGTTDDLFLWQSTINSYASLFSINLSSTSLKFYDGRMLVNLWSPRNSFECRLIVEKDAPIVTYETHQFEKAINYFQNHLRLMYYEHDLNEIETEGLDHCYDCRAEIFILEKYVQKTQPIDDEILLKKKIAELSYDISRNIYEKNRQPILNTFRTLNIISKK